MKLKTYLNSSKMQQSILSSLREMAQLVGSTLGPGGRTIIIEREQKSPLLTKDGVTVARHYQAEGDLERVIAESVKEVCEKTNRDAGDGTTTAIVLAEAIVREGQQAIAEIPTYSPQQLSRDLWRIFKDQVKPMVHSLTKEIRNLPLEEAKEAIRHVAMVSSNHDQEIADAVSDAVEYVGEDGMVVAEEGAGAETTVRHEQGFPFVSGLNDLGGSASVSFVNRQDYGDVYVNNAYIVLYDGEINDIETIAPILERVRAERDSDGLLIGFPVAVFAHGFSNNVLKMMSQNFRKNVLTCIPVKTPRNGQAHGRQQFLHDVASFVGGKVFDPHGVTLPEAHPPMLGFTETFKMTASEGVLLGEPELELVEKRIAELKKQMTGASDFDQDRLRYRISCLSGGVATVYAGGKTSLEAKERHARVVDAISAVRSAIMDGVVPGGGAALAMVSAELDDLYVSGKFKEVGLMILRKAFMAPINRIHQNAGLKTGPEWENMELTQDVHVSDVLNQTKVPWYEGGIMDPQRVTLSAVSNALSVAQNILTMGGAMAFTMDAEAEKVRDMQKGLMQAMEEA